MLSNQNTQTVQINKLTTEQTAELRRQMYERIARGNALAEAEEKAHRKLRDK